MAIKLKFNSDSALAGASKYARSAEYSFALEACTIFLFQLQRTAARLDDKLLEFNKSQTLFEINSAISDIWEIIELAHKIYKLYPQLDWKPGPVAQEQIGKVNALHDTLNNLPFLIRHFFSKPGNPHSILGDFRWGYRASLEAHVTQCFARAGELRQGASGELKFNSASLLSEKELHRFDGHLGIFGVELHYLARRYQQEKTEGTELIDCVVMLDDIIEGFNQIIEICERRFTVLMNQQLRSDPELDMQSTTSGPTIAVITPA
jgi:hypothetical protein